MRGRIIFERDAARWRPHHTNLDHVVAYPKRERTIIGIVVAGVLSRLFVTLSFIPPVKASPNYRYFPSFVRGGSNTNKMSADEQPQGLNGMDLIVDGELVAY